MNLARGQRRMELLSGPWLFQIGLLKAGCYKYYYYYYYYDYYYYYYYDHCRISGFRQTVLCVRAIRYLGVVTVGKMFPPCHKLIDSALWLHTDLVAAWETMKSGGS